MNRDESYKRPKTKKILAENLEGETTYFEAKRAQKNFKSSRLCLYPQDALEGGTWLAVTSHKTVCAVLNYYRTPSNPLPPSDKDMFLSRGQLPLILWKEPSLLSAEKKLKAQNLKLYKPFYIIFLQAQEGLIKCCFDGNVLEVERFPMRDFFLTTSGSKEDKALRLQLFESILKQPYEKKNLKLRQAFFKKNRTDSGLGFSMKSSYSQTQSYTEVCIKNPSIDFLYYNLHPNSYSDDIFFQKASCFTLVV